MAIPSQEQDQVHQCTMLDALYCEEQQWEDDDDEEEEETDIDIEIEQTNNKRNNPSSLNPLMVLEQDMFWDDEELIALLSKEKKEGYYGNFDGGFEGFRRESVEWMIMVSDYYGFSKLTTLLGVNYFDRFLVRVEGCELEKQPWMIQLLAVTCLSLAAKVEEPFVPLLLDLQVEGTKYMFEAKNIQKMELLVLTTLEWKMNVVTPLSFLDHIIRRLGFHHPLHREFYRRCENLLISLLPDWRMVEYLPSQLATATMLHVIDHIEPCNSLEYQNQLLSVLNIPKEKVDDCYKLIANKWSRKGSSNINISLSTKRKYEELMSTSTTTINETTNNMDSIPNNSNNSSWVNANANSFATTTTLLSLSSSSLSAVSSPPIRFEKKGGTIQEHGMDIAVSSPPIRFEKKGRTIQERGMDIAMPMPLKLNSLARVFVDVVDSPH